MHSISNFAREEEDAVDAIDEVVLPCPSCLSTSHYSLSEGTGTCPNCGGPVGEDLD